METKTQLRTTGATGLDRFKRANAAKRETTYPVQAYWTGVKLFGESRTESTRIRGLPARLHQPGEVNLVLVTNDSHNGEDAVVTVAALPRFGGADQLRLDQVCGVVARRDGRTSYQAEKHHHLLDLRAVAGLRVDPTAFPAPELLVVVDYQLKDAEPVIHDDGVWAYRRQDIKKPRVPGGTLVLDMGPFRGVTAALPDVVRIDDVVCAAAVLRPDLTLESLAADAAASFAVELPAVLEAMRQPDKEVPGIFWEALEGFPEEIYREVARRVLPSGLAEFVGEESEFQQNAAGGWQVTLPACPKTFEFDRLAGRKIEIAGAMPGVFKLPPL